MSEQHEADASGTAPTEASRPLPEAGGPAAAPVAAGVDPGTEPAADTDTDTATAADAPDAPADAPVLRIALAPGVTPTKWTRVWQQRRPDLPLRISPAPEAQLAAILLDARADAAFVRGPVDDERLSAIALYDEQPVAVVGRDHLLADEAAIDVADLATEHLLQDPDSVPEWAAIAHEIADGSRRPLPRLDGLDDAVEQVAAGVGVVILPQSLARVHGRKDVRVLALTGVATTRVSLAWVTEAKTDDIEDFIGVVRGRSVNSTRGRAAEPEEAPRAKAAPPRPQRPKRPAGKPVAQRYRPRKPRKG